MNVLNSLNPLDIARETLLTPFGLDQAALDATFAELFTHRIDDADLYFQYTRSEGWSLEEGIVKAGSFNIDQGVGVRALVGEKTAFAYSDDINLAALKRAAQTTPTTIVPRSYRDWETLLFDNCCVKFKIDSS